MNHCCYILHSKKLLRYYVGYSSNLDLRLIFHKNSEPRKYTYNAKDWKLYYKIDCNSKKQGIAIEKHIKRMKSKVYIENLLKYPEITIRLLKKYEESPGH
ncbi:MULTISPECIES: GIY-YIG nuclease family protein [Winogradskyella]|uniref:GIY-YIG nuclease family protein n=1 Tax=Winogradskyella TaxID=286104 RepID=UPI0015BE8E37|nr:MULTISPECIES: GIY-YIG nuclease family protein [Winogradskyella]MBU2926898.1 GIY-YIG nuclease family protein [Winogradskyella psychrotolerans]